MDIYKLKIKNIIKNVDKNKVEEIRRLLLLSLFVLLLCKLSINVYAGSTVEAPTELQSLIEKAINTIKFILYIHIVLKTYFDVKDCKLELVDSLMCLLTGYVKYGVVEGSLNLLKTIFKVGSSGGLINFV